MAVRREYIADLYRNVLGREGSEGEISGWENSPDEKSVSDMFYGSPEYTSQHGGEAKWQDVGGVITPTDSDPRLVTPPDMGPQGGSQDSGGYAGDAGGGYTGGAEGFNPTTGDWRKLQGFNSENYYNPEMNSVKYTFARIANEYEPTPEGLKRLVQDPRFKAAFPNARLVDVDKIDFGGAPADGKTGSPVGVIDVGGAFDAKTNTGRNWWWGYEPGPIGERSAQATTGTPSGTTTQRPTSSSSGNNLANFGQLGQVYGGPGSPGIFQGPVQQVGQDPLSQLITGGLADFIGRGGTTAFGQQMQDYLSRKLGMGGGEFSSEFGEGGEGFDPTTGMHAMDLLPGESGGGGTGIDQGNVNRRFESARELMEKGRRTMTNDTRGALANRNLLSEPGIPQGAEIGAVRRIEESLAPEFSRALRDIYTDESTKADAKQMGYLQMATGLSQDQARNFLAGIGEGTARQTALANIALQSLSQNMAWSQFLAEFGLKRDTVLAQLQQGRVDDVMGLLNSFLSLTVLSRGGYIGND